MNTEVVAKFLSTLPEDDDHPYRTKAWRPQTTEWNADDLAAHGEIPADLDGIYATPENPLHPALQVPSPFDGDGMMHIVGFRDGRRSTATGLSAPTVSRPKTRQAAHCGPASPNRSARQTRSRLGCTDPDEGRVEHRRHGAPRQWH